MCRTLRAESECRERLADFLDNEEASTDSGDFSEDTESSIDSSDDQDRSQEMKRWADLFEHEPTSAHQEATVASSEDQDRSNGKARWADLSDDEATVASLEDQDRSQEKKRWADFSDDEQTPAHQRGASDFFDAHDCSMGQQWILAQTERSSAKKENKKKAFDVNANDGEDDWTQVKKHNRKRVTKHAHKALEQLRWKKDGGKTNQRIRLSVVQPEQSAH